jgi:aspartate/methionine/tyrosine aminotransferase
MATTQQDELANLRTMRDVFDYCQSKNLFSVAQGMIELPPPRLLREIVARSILDESHQELHQYRARFGETDYLAAIRNLLQKHYGVEVPQGAILATSGVTGALIASLMLLRKQGKSTVAVIEPYYTYHSRHVQVVFDKMPLGIPSHDDFSPNWDEIEKAVKEQKVDAILLANPGNPTGRVWSKEEIQRLTKLTKEHNCTLILDEIYCDMVFDGAVHYSPIYDSLEEHVIVCRGFSKTLGAQSWRIGYAVSHPSVIVNLMAQHDPIYISVSWQQHGMAEYLEKHYDDFVRHIEEINSLLRANYKVLTPAFQQALGWQPMEPSGSMYGMFRHNEPTDLAALQSGLRLGVGVAPGGMFFVADPPRSGLIRIHVGFTHDKAKQIAQTLLDAAAKQSKESAASQ